MLLMCTTISLRAESFLGIDIASRFCMVFGMRRMKQSLGILLVPLMISLSKNPLLLI